MQKRKLQQKRGFVILFAVTISSILLAIALGVSYVAYKEIKFGTSAKSTNESFFAADAGVEYALFNDKSGSSSFVPASGTFQSWNTAVSSAGSSCASIHIEKDDRVSPMTTTIIVKGYNIGNYTQ